MEEEGVPPSPDPVCLGKLLDYVILAIIYQQKGVITNKAELLGEIFVHCFDLTHRIELFECWLNPDAS